MKLLPKYRGQSINQSFLFWPYLIFCLFLLHLYFHWSISWCHLCWLPLCFFQISSLYFNCFLFLFLSILFPFALNILLKISHFSMLLNNFVVDFFSFYLYMLISLSILRCLPLFSLIFVSMQPVH